MEMKPAPERSVVYTVYLRYCRYSMLSYRTHCEDLWLGFHYNFDSMDGNYVNRYAGL